MRRLLVIPLLLATSLACAAGGDVETPIAVYFSPDGGCTEAIVRELARARSNVLVQAYSFSSSPIAKALVQAKQRGVNVRLVIDKSVEEEPHSSANTVARGGVPVLVDSQHSIAHNKVMIIDDQVVITGSFNFTHAAEAFNAENLLVIRDRDLARKYSENWRLHAAHSKPYVLPRS